MEPDVDRSTPVSGDRSSDDVEPRPLNIDQSSSKAERFTQILLRQWADALAFPTRASRSDPGPGCTPLLKAVFLVWAL